MYTKANVTMTYAMKVNKLQKHIIYIDNYNVRT